MNGRFDPIFCGLVCGVTLWLALLWAGARLKIGRPGRTVKIILGVATVFLLFAPAGRLSVWSWAFSICPNPSVPMLGVICAALWRNLFGVAVFKPADWRATWNFGAVAGTLLYLHPFAVGALDLYYWGWHPVVALSALAGLAILLLAWGNRLGVLLLAALFAFELETLESQNCWDYVVDPFFWIVSLGFVIARAFRAWRGGRVRPGAEGTGLGPATIRPV